MLGWAVGSGLGDALGSGLDDALGSGLDDALGSGVVLGSALGDGSPDPDGSGLGLGDAGGTGAADRFCGIGAGRTAQSAAFWFVSVTLPPLPPGRRSMLWPGGGAAAAVPSTKAFVASPQPIASIGVPPTCRRTSAPPVAAKPPEYVASAVDAYVPVAFATSRCWPVTSSVSSVQVAFLVTVEPEDVT